MTDEKEASTDQNSRRRQYQQALANALGEYFDRLSTADAVYGGAMLNELERLRQRNRNLRREVKRLLNYQRAFKTFSEGDLKDRIKLTTQLAVAEARNENLGHLLDDATARIHELQDRLAALTDHATV